MATEVPTYSAGGRISSWTLKRKPRHPGYPRGKWWENDGKWWENDGKWWENGWKMASLCQFHNCNFRALWPTANWINWWTSIYNWEILHRGIGKPEILSKRLRLRHHPFLRLTPQAPIQTNTWFDLICKPTLTLWGELHQIGVCKNRIQYDTIQPKMIKHGYVNPENDEKPLKFTGTLMLRQSQMTTFRAPRDKTNHNLGLCSSE